MGLLRLNTLGSLFLAGAGGLIPLINYLSEKPELPQRESHTSVEQLYKPSTEFVNGFLGAASLLCIASSLTKREEKREERRIQASQNLPYKLR
ncbi:MAG: hypothetical protein IIA87_04745 [Nanoarchaeota archaeon]|nr:hypothetical protein [Nanoarchaeota archaeon]